MTVLFSEAQIAQAIDRIADEICRDSPADTILAPILTGAFIFAADLSRALSKRGKNWEVDFLHLSSYGAGRESSGEVRLVKDVIGCVTGHTVILIDDVLDSGRSLAFAKTLMEERGAGAVKICVLADKRTGRPHGVIPDYVGFVAPSDAYLVGYGMDDAGRGRGAPDIRVATPFTDDMDHTE